MSSGADRPYVAALVALIGQQPRRLHPDARLRAIAGRITPALEAAVVEAWRDHEVTDLRIGSLVIDDRLIDESFRLPTIAKEGRGPHADWHLDHGRPQDDFVVLGRIGDSGRGYLGLRLGPTVRVEMIDLSRGTHTRGLSLDQVLQRELLSEPECPLWPFVEHGINRMTGAIHLSEIVLRAGLELSALDRAVPLCDAPNLDSPSLLELLRAQHEPACAGVARWIVSQVGRTRVVARATFRAGLLHHVWLRLVSPRQSQGAVPRQRLHGPTRVWLRALLGSPTSEGAMSALWGLRSGQLHLSGADVEIAYHPRALQPDDSGAADCVSHRCAHCGGEVARGASTELALVDLTTGATPCPRCGVALWVSVPLGEEPAASSVCEVGLHTNPRVSRFTLVPRWGVPFVAMSCSECAPLLLDDAGARPKLGATIAAVRSPCALVLVSQENLAAGNALLGADVAKAHYWLVTEQLKRLGHLRELETGVWLVAVHAQVGDIEASVSRAVHANRSVHPFRVVRRVVDEDAKVVGSETIGRAVLWMGRRAATTQRGDTPRDDLLRAWAALTMQDETNVPVLPAFVPDQIRPEACPQCGDAELIVVRDMPGCQQLVCEGCGSTVTSRLVVRYGSIEHPLEEARRWFGPPALRTAPPRALLDL